MDHSRKTSVRQKETMTLYVEVSRPNERERETSLNILSNMLSGIRLIGLFYGYALDDGAVGICYLDDINAGYGYADRAVAASSLYS